MVRAAERVGVKTEAVFRSGPFCVPEPSAESEVVEALVYELVHESWVAGLHGAGAPDEENEVVQLRARLLRSLREPREWQPGNTAPRDGTFILGWWSGSDCEDYPPEAVRYGVGGKWVNDYGNEYMTPDCWMPLPDPPLVPLPERSEPDRG
jgi:hypothetical protein